MGYRTARGLVGPSLLDPYRRKVMLASTTASRIVRSLAELRRHRGITQVELAERLERAQASISAMEAAGDHLLSTVDAVVSALGGQLELVAVFRGERIALAFT